MTSAIFVAESSAFCYLWRKSLYTVCRLSDHKPRYASWESSGNLIIISLIDGTAIIVASARDRTSSRELAAMCNRLGLSLLHFDDVIEDFLS